VLLRPTDEGRRVRAEVDRARAADSDRLFARLSADDRNTLARLLRTLTDDR
jgi:DNA-binding MarR family transcriptional regulator